MKKYIFSAFLLISTIALDLLTKNLVVKNIGLYERINVFGEFVQLTLVYNRGGLFGILQGYQNFFLIVSLIVLLFLILFYIFEKKKTLLFCTSMALITSGAVGNIIDRISGRPGVVDFMSIGSDNYFRWPAFNVADAVIVIGAFLLLLVFYKEEKKRKNTESNNN